MRTSTLFGDDYLSLYEWLKEPDNRVRLVEAWRSAAVERKTSASHLLGQFIAHLGEGGLCDGHVLSVMGFTAGLSRAGSAAGLNELITNAANWLADGQAWRLAREVADTRPPWAAHIVAEYHGAGETGSAAAPKA